MSDLIRCLTIVKLLQSKFALVLQSHSEGTSLRGISRITGLAYNTVVSIVRAASQKAQQLHNAQIQAIQTQEVSCDEMWSFVQKNRSNVSQVNQK